MRMYFKYIVQQLKISLQYRSATFMMMFVGFITSLGSLYGVILLFDRFSNIAGYTLEEVLLMFSVVLFVFSFCELFFRGFDTFETLVKSGDLDQLFIRPRGIFLQVLGYKMEFGKIGRVILSVGVLIYAALNSTIQWNALKVVTLLLMVISGIFIFLGIFLLSSSVNIFTIQGNEFVNIFTNGGRDIASYPLDIFNKFIKTFFTFIVPFACFNFIPLQFLMGSRSATILGNMLAPLYGILFVVPCFYVFKWALTKYSSSGT